MAIKKLRKKGIFLTFIAIAIIAAIIIIFTPSGINLGKNVPVIKTRVSNVNEYVLDLENVYLERTLQATGRKTIIALIRYMTEETIKNGEENFLTDFNAAFSEVLLDGKIGGVDIDTYYDDTIMTGNTYNDSLDKIKTIAKSTFNVDTSFVINNIQVAQVTPWFVDAEADITLSVTSETASWEKNVIIKTVIDIENFDDPYYLVKTSGDYVNKIEKSGIKFDEWGVDGVNDHISKGTYVHFENGNAPSFIDRFTNNIAQSPCCGIESLVDPNSAAISSKFVSYVDYSYWETLSDCDNQNLYEINGVTSGIKLDFGSIGRYKLLADADKICPSE